MILDTNAVSALFEGDSELGAILSSGRKHHLPVIVLGEYRFGIAGSSQRDLLLPLLDQLEAESIVLNLDSKSAMYYAGIRERLKANGTPIPENDVWIAALAKQHGLSIASRDRHFDSVEEVNRIEW